MIWSTSVTLCDDAINYYSEYIASCTISRLLLETQLVLVRCKHVLVFLVHLLDHQPEVKLLRFLRSLLHAKIHG